MSGARSPMPLSRLTAFFRAAMVFWALVVGLSFLWSLRSGRQALTELARREAELSLQKDLSLRGWVTARGGVYVPVDAGVGPNPLLASHPERDIVTPGGRRLTLMNPACVLRSLYEFAHGRPFAAHLTSLCPVSSFTRPDPWEETALRRLQAGEQAVEETVTVEGELRFRSMVPVVTEGGCCQCHDGPGSKEGEIRGGLSVSVPLGAYAASLWKQDLQLIVSHLCIFLLGFGGIRWARRQAVDHLHAEEKAEVSLKESEERFRSLVETSSDWVWEMDTAMVYTYCSPRVFDQLGYQPAELVGKPLGTLVPEEEGRRLREFGATVVRERRPIVDLITHLTTKSGRRVTLETNAVPVFGPDGVLTGYRGIHRDVTERERVQAELRREKERAQSYLDLANVMIISIDRAGLVILANPRACEVLGWHRDEIIGHNWFDTFLPEGMRASVRQTHQRILAGDLEPARYFENPVLTRSGEQRLIAWHNATLRDVHGQILGSLSSGDDITERRRVEDELNRLRDLLASIIDSMPSILVGVDEALRVVQWSREAGKVAAPGEVRGRTLSLAFPCLGPFVGRVRKAIEERRVVSEPQVLLSYGGDTRLADITIYPLLGAGLGGAVLRVDDVTERARLAEMMVQTEKMMSVGGLAAGMAHEINNPLAGILQSVQVIQQRIAADSPANLEAAREAGVPLPGVRAFLARRHVDEMLDNVREAGVRASRIVANMLAFARKSTGTFTPQRLEEVLDSTVELIQTDYNLSRTYDFQQIEMIREYQPDLPLVPCDRGMIQQVFFNILKNGAEAMWGERERRRPCFRLRASRAEEMVRIDIVDNGPGMDESVRRRIFDPFFTTKPVGKGTGLGLSVSFFIVVRHHGGRLTVDGHPGQGCTFTVELPIGGKRE